MISFIFIIILIIIIIIVIIIVIIIIIIVITTIIIIIIIKINVHQFQLEGCCTPNCSTSLSVLPQAKVHLITGTTVMMIKDIYVEEKR